MKMLVNFGYLLKTLFGMETKRQIEKQQKRTKDISMNGKTTPPIDIRLALNKTFVARSYSDVRDIIPRHKTRKWRKRKRLDKIVVHTTASDNQNPVATARYHVKAPNHISKKGCPSICYHDFITKEGQVLHCNNYEDITWHTKGWNTTAVGITMAFKGQDGEPPCNTQYLATVEQCVWLCLKFHILPKNVRGHREGPGIAILGKGPVRYKKTCPGMGVDLEELRDFVCRKLQEILREVGLYEGLVDGKFGRKSKKALAWVVL